jgi:hypothetical protein
MCTQEPNAAWWAAPTADMSYMHTSNGKLRLAPRLKYTCMRLLQGLQPSKLRAPCRERVHICWYTIRASPTIGTIRQVMYLLLARTQQNTTSKTQQFHLVNAGAYGRFLPTNPAGPQQFSLNQRLPQGLKSSKIAPFTLNAKSSALQFGDFIEPG